MQDLIAGIGDALILSNVIFIALGVLLILMSRKLYSKVTPSEEG